jgi:hypothetical protein
MPARSQLGLNPYPFDVALRAGRVLPKLVWDVQHLAGLHQQLVVCDPVCQLMSR